MKAICLVIIALVMIFNFKSKSQEKIKVDREPAVAGSFYLSNPAELKTDLASLFASSGKVKTDKNIAAVIVPHAGYIFSGKVAASAFAQIDPDRDYETVFLIGTSHQVHLSGASIYDIGDFKTPLGTVKVDMQTSKKLIQNYKVFESSTEAHKREHSLEVQLPFLQFHLKKPFQIVPIIIGTQSAKTCEKIAEALKPFFTDKNLFVISSDFSHYPTYNDARNIDKVTGDAILSNSPELFMQKIADNSGKNIAGLATSCCSWTSVLTLMYITSEIQGITVRHIKYMNSGDTKYGDKERVVGYHSFAFSRDTEDGSFSLADDEKQLLLSIARKSIENRLKGKSVPLVSEPELTESLKLPCGSFVTLYKNGKLRGCIGRFFTDGPLYRLVKDIAVAAAFNDSRFEPLAKSELTDIDIEVSVLTPLHKINDIKEFQLGKHGIYMVKGNQSGTFLPKVATDTGWKTEEFLGHCARDKAGIGWDGWKNAELFVYEAYVFGEKQLNTAK